MKFRAVLFSVLAASAAVAGCGGSSSSSSPATTSPSAGTSPAGAGGAAPATLNVAYDQDLTTGDPAMTGSPGDMNLLINVFDPLVQRDNAGKLQPSLATSWKLVKSVTFTMSTSIYVGLPVTSHNNALLCAATLSNVTVTSP